MRDRRQRRSLLELELLYCDSVCDLTACVVHDRAGPNGCTTGCAKLCVVGVRVGSSRRQCLALFVSSAVRRLGLGWRARGRWNRPGAPAAMHSCMKHRAMHSPLDAVGGNAVHRVDKVQRGPEFQTKQI